MDALGSLFQKAEGLGLIEGVSNGGDVVPISHVRFVDDTILFSSLRQEAVTFKRIIRWFELVSRLKVNSAKSITVGDGSYE